jgi:hypothetical protein
MRDKMQLIRKLDEKEMVQQENYTNKNELVEQELDLQDLLLEKNDE